MTYEHPTGNTPKNVALVALGPSKADFFEMQTPHEPLAAFDEVWTMNTGLRFVKHDLVFIMDDLLDFGSRYPEYGTAMRGHGKPILTSATYAEYPAAVRYPIEAVIAAAPQSANYYHHNSVPYVLAYANWLGVERIALFGCDYSYPNMAHREEGQAVTAFWCGYLRGRGIEVDIAQGSSLLETGRRVADPLFRQFYGYLRQPTLRAPVA